MPYTCFPSRSKKRPLQYSIALHNCQNTGGEAVCHSPHILCFIMGDRHRLSFLVLQQKLTLISVAGESVLILLAQFWRSAIEKMKFHNLNTPFSYLGESGEGERTCNSCPPPGIIFVCAVHYIQTFFISLEVGKYLHLVHPSLKSLDFPGFLR